ncbi:MAG TPA: DUF4097 family beta strand repeat-containing protein [Acidobacteriaceae bacterium]|nr:DUF4097 family beta strand repeat-containing protein [Acidobacteriaceae bacterium]
MTARPLLLSALLLGFTTAALADSTFDRTLNVSAQPDLYVSTGSGNIHITPGGGSQIHVIGHVHVSWSAFGDVGGRVQRIVENPPITQDGNTVRVGEVTDHSLFNNISIDYDISVPNDVALNLHSGSGDIEVNHVGRFLSASSGSGNVRAHGLHGPADLESGSGDLELEDDAPGDVKAKTGSGDIQVHGFSGPFNARTGSGDITADGHLQGSSMITAGSGDVKLHLTPDSRFTLEASTGSGDIHVHMPGVSSTNDDSSRHHVTTSINGGGPPLEIRTGSGDIEISPR